MKPKRPHQLSVGNRVHRHDGPRDHYGYIRELTVRGDRVPTYTIWWSDLGPSPGWIDEDLVTARGKNSGPDDDEDDDDEREGDYRYANLGALKASLMPPSHRAVTKPVANPLSLRDVGMKAKVDGEPGFSVVGVLDGGRTAVVRKKGTWKTRKVEAERVRPDFSLPGSR